MLAVGAAGVDATLRASAGVLTGGKNVATFPTRDFFKDADEVVDFAADLPTKGGVATVVAAVSVN